LYSQSEVNRGLPAPLLVKHFHKVGLQWQVKDHVRNLMQFIELNLIERWPPLSRMDIIFLRNVLIYFSSETKRAILDKIARQLAPDGYLFLGGAETTLNLSDAFDRVNLGKTVCYRLRG
jgi:chemotaxis protein methyltransferase CheR